MRSLPIGILGIALAVAGCAPHLTRTATDDALSRIRKVGVMSITSTEFHRQYVGVTAFGNEHEKRSIRDWKLDDEYEAQMVEALAKIGKVEAVRATYDREQLRPPPSPDGFDAAFRPVDSPTLAAALKDVARASGVDALFIAVPALLQEPGLAGLGGVAGAITTPPPTPTGIRLRTFMGASSAVLYVPVRVWFVDGRSGLPLAVAFLAKDQRGASSTSVPMKVLDYSRAGQRKIADWTPDEEREYREILVEIVRLAWPATLSEMLAVRTELSPLMDRFVPSPPPRF